MGLYINRNSKGEELPAIGKVAKLIQDGAELLFNTPTKLVEGLICVVSNGPFDAAAFAYSEEEMSYFAREQERQTVWLLWDKARELAK